jgi:UDP-N-acetylmuramate dehydrogenase
MAGLRGIQIGNAKISEDHANFILNLGDASAKDVMSLIKKTQEEVLRQFGVKLEPEIRILGGFDKCTM